MKVNLFYWMYGLLGAGLMAGFLRFIHVWKRQHQMKCHRCGNIWGVKKIYKMIHIVGNWYEMYVLGYCNDCRSVALIRTENKEFSLSQIDRRETKFPEQFEQDEELFKKAGLSTDANKILDLHLSQIESHPRTNRLRVEVGK